MLARQWKSQRSVLTSTNLVSDDLRVVVGKSYNRDIILDAAEASGVTPRLISKCLRFWSHARRSPSRTISLRKGYGGSSRNYVFRSRFPLSRLNFTPFLHIPPSSPNINFVVVQRHSEENGKHNSGAFTNDWRNFVNIL